MPVTEMGHARQLSACGRTRFLKMLLFWLSLLVVPKFQFFCFVLFYILTISKFYLGACFMKSVICGIISK